MNPIAITPIVYSIIGPNGAGKSTSAQLIADVEHFDFDARLQPLMSNIEAEILNDDSAFDFYRAESVKEIQSKLIGWSNNKICSLESFSLAHNFFPGYNSNDPVVTKALQAGYKHKVVYMGVTNIKTCIRRVQLRALKGYHNIPTPDIIERYSRGLNQFNELCKNILNGNSLPVHIDEIRVMDYTSDEEIENILDCKKGKVQLLTKNENLVAQWKELISEMFRLI